MVMRKVAHTSKRDSFPAEDLRTKEQFPVIPTNDRKSGEPRAAATFMVAVIIAGILLTAELQRLADDWGPQTGDIVSLPATQMPSISTTSITVNPAGAARGGPCVLDLHIMQKSGGSFVVEATHSNRSRLSGSLGRHADKRWPGRLWGLADLLLNVAQMNAIIFAAGGTGGQSPRTKHRQSLVVNAAVATLQCNRSAGCPVGLRRSHGPSGWH